MTNVVIGNFSKKNGGKRLAFLMELWKKFISEKSLQKQQLAASMANIGRKGKQQDPTQCPTGIDTSTYFSPVIGEEIRSVIPLLHATPIETVQSFINAIFHYILSHAIVSELNEDIYGKGLPPKDVNQIVSGLYLIIQTALRNKVKLSVIKADLLKMNVPAPVVEEITKQVMTSRLPYELTATQNRAQFYKLEKIRWRIDVVISSGSLSRVMRPNILMQMIMKDGKVFSFEITFEKFSLLRYSVAKVLHDMQTLERHPIIRIVNEFRRIEEKEYNN